MMTIHIEIVTVEKPWQAFGYLKTRIMHAYMRPYGIFESASIKYSGADMCTNCSHYILAFDI